jgi:hypothetical protein
LPFHARQWCPPPQSPFKGIRSGLFQEFQDGLDNLTSLQVALARLGIPADFEMTMTIRKFMRDHNLPPEEIVRIFKPLRSQ